MIYTFLCNLITCVVGFLIGESIYNFIFRARNTINGKFAIKIINLEADVKLNRDSIKGLRDLVSKLNKGLDSKE